MDGGKIDVNITFDENNQIRVLSSDKYRETENLKSECIDFLKSKWPLIFEFRLFSVLHKILRSYFAHSFIQTADHFSLNMVNNLLLLFYRNHAIQ